MMAGANGWELSGMEVAGSVKLIPSRGDDTFVVGVLLEEVECLPSGHWVVASMASPGTGRCKGSIAAASISRKFYYNTSIISYRYYQVSMLS